MALFQANSVSWFRTADNSGNLWPHFEEIP